MGLASLGLEISILGDILYSVLLMNAIFGLDSSGRAPSRPQVRGDRHHPFRAARGRGRHRRALPRRPLPERPPADRLCPLGHVHHSVRGRLRRVLRAVRHREPAPPPSLSTTSASAGTA
jgi:hypothetical protein